MVDKDDLIAVYSNLQLDKSADAAFTRGSWTCRMTLRVGWEKVHANRHVKFTFKAPTP